MAIDPKWPTRRAFEVVPETCPVVQAALDGLVSDLLDDFGDEEKIGSRRYNRQIDRLKAHCFKVIEERTTALRGALIDALEKVQELAEAEQLAEREVSP